MLSTTSRSTIAAAAVRPGTDASDIVDVIVPRVGTIGSVSMYLPVWLYSYHQPGKNGGMLHYIAVNGRTGETMGSVPVQQWKMLLAALATGTVIEALAIAFLVAST